MKKSLFLLPLLAALTLCGCNDDKGGGGDDDKGGSDASVVLDFTDAKWKSEKITPYVSDNTTVLSFTYENINYNDAGCYASAYEGTNWLMMKNKWEDGKVAAGEHFAFFGNADSYGKAIKKIVVTTSSQGGAVDFYVNFGDSAFGSDSCAGTKKSVEASTETVFTAENSGDSEYFAITAAKAVGQYRKNGGIAKVEIYLK